MRISYKAPGSCGEFIQGFIDGSERLISMPIDIYSTVTIETGTGKIKGTVGSKTKRALEEFLRLKDLPRESLNRLDITVDTNLPVSKGMASSTADMLGILYCAKDYFEKDLDEGEIAQICCSIEPTDSTIFKSISLFDHINGLAYKHYSTDLKLKVLILEMDDMVDTLGFRDKGYDVKRQDSQSTIEMALSFIEEGFSKNDYTLIGKACNLSSVANQSVLHKPYLEEIMTITKEYGGCGVNVAHSGTVIGILFEEGTLDIQGLISRLEGIGALKYYNKNYVANVINSGVKKLK